MNNLGCAYQNRLNGEESENIEKAIWHFTNAPEVRTRESYAEQWATTTSSVGVAPWNARHASRVRTSGTFV